MTATEPPATDGDCIRFLLDGQPLTVSTVDPNRTVLQYLREDLRRTGTKEGCAEGDCGACTVVVAEAEGDRLRCRAVNACIQFLPALDGKALFTVESLAAANGELHPVQQALVDCHGSQCGFCTPGFVMSLFALYKSSARPARRAIDDALAGNLCRCTGYRPIIDAAGRMYEIGAAERRPWLRRPYADGAGAEADERELAAALARLGRRSSLVLRHAGRRWFAPRSLDELVALAADHADARLLAGGTDVGLWVTKQQRDLDTIIHLGAVPELRRMAVADGHLEIGAAVTLSEAMPLLVKRIPELDELLRRFASPPIRNVATLGGNIANGSPIGDTMPALIALGATLVLRDAGGAREIALDEFYPGYRRTALRPGEIIERIRLPLPTAATRFRTWKVSKRFDQDISAVCGAFRIDLDGRRIGLARVAFGGVAATPMRATACERALCGRHWSEDTADAAMAALDLDFEPISDMRASAGYRRRVTRNLVRRFYLETTAAEVPSNVHAYAR